MSRQREAWYRNPFRLGGAGLAALLAGYGALETAPAGVPASPLAVTGQVVFLLGVVTMLVAGVLWFIDAHRPGPPVEEDMEEEPVDDDEVDR